jgi:hypothetical protein
LIAVGLLIGILAGIAKKSKDARGKSQERRSLPDRQAEKGVPAELGKLKG